MMRILPALVALCQGHCLLAYVHSTTTVQQINTDKDNSNTVNKSLEFVNIIRDDLRRNNDDYDRFEVENQLADTAPLAHLGKSSHPVHPAYSVLPGNPTPRQPYRNIISSPVPRLEPLHPLPSRSAYPSPPPEQTAHSPARAAPLRRFDTRKSEADLSQPAAINLNQFRSYTLSKQYKTQRLNKLKQLLNKDKINMRQEDLVEDEPQAEGQPEVEGRSEAEDTTTASPPVTEPTTPEHKPPLSPLTHAPTTQRQPFRSHQEGRGLGSMLRNRKDQSPSPDQLDMAPARNPQITRIRIKGRLCQRSLMNAEGPTYDKLGKLLAPAHQPRSVRGRKFHQTRAPSLVLPRCCNCCKKSVLGCQ